MALQHALKINVKHWILSDKHRFDTFNQYLDCAASSEFKPEDKLPGGQQQLRQTGESQKGSNRKQNFPPSISEPAEIPSINSNNSYNTGKSNLGQSNGASEGSRANLEPVPGLSNNASEGRNDNAHCTCCCSGANNTYLGTKYGKSSPHKLNSTNIRSFTGNQIKRQKAFDMQR